MSGGGKDGDEKVAPRVGAWIEIFFYLHLYDLFNVAPRVGAWIEILIKRVKFERYMSLPVWERGLKYQYDCRGTCIREVAPRVGAWIEIAAYFLTESKS